MSLADDASLLLIPTGYKAGKVYSVFPTDGDGDFTFSRSGDATRINPGGYIETVGTNVPRIDHFGGGCPSLKLEPQRTNLITYSEDYTQWTLQSGVTVSLNTTETLSPSGEQNASKIVGDGTNGLYKLNAGTGGGTNTKSIYIKGTQAGQVVYLKDPNQTVNTKALTLTTDWQRYTLTESQTNAFGIWIDDIPTSGIYMWGAQVEQSDYATSYIPTNGSAATRNRDLCDNAGDANTFNDSEGVLFAQIGVELDNGFVSLNDGTTSNRISIYLNRTNRTIRMICSSGGVGQADSTYTSPTSISENVKIALKYKENDFALWVDGSEVRTDNSALTPIGLSRCDFSVNTILPFYGKCKDLRVYNTALTDTELQELTTI